MHKRAQSSLEYAVVILCAVLAILAMRVYITRGMQGRIRQAADELGQAYDTRHTTSDLTTQQEGHTVSTTRTITNTETHTTQTISTTNIDERERRFGDETVEALQ